MIFHVPQLSLTCSFILLRSDGLIPFYKDNAGKRDKSDDTGSKKPSQWTHFSLETLLLLWVDYIRVTVKWRGMKLVILRHLIGTPTIVSEKKREVERLTGGIRFVTNLIELDMTSKASTRRTRKLLSRLDRIVPEQWKFSYFLEQLTHKDDDKRVRLDCTETFPEFNRFVMDCSDQANKDFIKQSKMRKSGRKRSDSQDDAYSPPRSKSKKRAARKGGTPRSAKGSKKHESDASDGDTDEEKIVEDLDESSSEEEGDPEPTEKVSLAAVIAELRTIGTPQCTLPFEDQLGAIQWMTENSCMTVTVNRNFRAHFGHKKKVPLPSFPAAMGTFADAAYQNTVVAKETEQRETEALQLDTIQKKAHVLLDSASVQQQELDRLKRMVELRPRADRIPRKPKTPSDRLGPEGSGSDNDGSPAKRLKETPAIPKVRKDPPTEQAPDSTCASDDLDEDKQPEKRKRDGDVQNDDGKEEAGSPERSGKVGVKARSGKGGGCSEDVPSKKRQKDDDDEDEGDRDGSEGDRVRDDKETASKGGGAAEAKDKGAGTNADQAGEQKDAPPTTKKARTTPDTTGKYLGMPQADDSELDTDDSDDDSVATVITKCIPSIPVVSPVVTPTASLYSFDEDDGIKNVLDFEDGVHEEHDTALTDLQIPDDFDNYYF